MQNKLKQPSFQSYGLSEEIINALEALGYQEPTEIQQEVIPVALLGRDMIAKSQTGTGKTAAFAIPICEQVKWEENLPQALILEPTRELAVQTQGACFHLGRKKRLKVPALFGGFPIDKQIQSLRQKSHIVVGTPGRIMDHLRRESLNLSKTKYLVIDEADLMLDMGFAEEVTQIIEQLPEYCQFLLFSATMNEKVQELTERYMKDAAVIFLEAETETVDKVIQEVYEISVAGQVGDTAFGTAFSEDASQDIKLKYECLKEILYRENPDSCMIFCGTREMVNVLFQKLRRDRIFCGMLHGEMEQKERLKTIDAFHRGGFRYLIATDVASRGIDFDAIPLVINYDFPTGKETYVHRIGRTARNGKAGKAISLVSEEEKKMLHMVETYIGKSITWGEWLGKNEAQEKKFWAKQRQKPKPRAGKGEELNKDILRLSIGGGRKSKMRAMDIVGTICSIPGVEADDIGIIDVRESLTYVEIRNDKGQQVQEALQQRPVKGKIRKVRITR